MQVEDSSFSLSVNVPYYAWIGLVLQEVEFSGGAVGTSSLYSTNPSYAAENAFKQTNAHWNSGRDPDGSGELTQPYPHLIW